MTTTQSTPKRASPLSAADRRESILDATLPLIMEHGASVSSRQIADAAGVAEGTIFRAFGDKDAIIGAAVERFLDPERLRSSLRSIDPSAPLEQKVHDLVFHTRSYFTGIMGIMAAIGMRKPPHRPRTNHEYLDIVARVVGEDAARLRVEPTVVAYIVRLLAFASSMKPLNLEYEFTTDELTDLIVYGITGTKEK